MLLITGANGQLGRCLRDILPRGEALYTDAADLDITQEAAVLSYGQEKSFSAIINCAAYTNVDQAEPARRINACGPANLAKLAAAQNIPLIHLSTDYVFDGASSRPYHEFDAANGGATVYGQSKFAGEEAVRRCCPDHVICRISWLYGPGGPSFVHAMLKLADGSRPVLKVVDDQRGNPTSTLAVANALRGILNRPLLTGTFHLTCEGEASWYEFACEIFRQRGIEQKVIPCTTSEFPRPAPRPANSRLEKRMLRLCNLPPMPEWRDALREFLAGEF